MNVERRGRLIGGNPRQRHRMMDAFRTQVSDDARELNTTAFHRIQIEVVPATQPIRERDDDEQVTDDEGKGRLKTSNEVG